MPITIGSASDNTTGNVSATLDSFSVDFDGTNANTPDIDGAISRGLNTFKCSLNGGWPARWPQSRGAYVISDRNNVLGNPAYTSWTYNSDMVIFQGIYPSPSNIDNMVSLLSAQRSNYPSCKFIEYTIPVWGFNDTNTTFNHRRLQQELVYDDFNAENEWHLTNPNTGGFLEGSGDQSGVRMTNVSDVCPTVGGKTFIEAYVDKWYNEFEEDDCVFLFDGVYFDSLDINNAFPQPVDISTGLDYDGVPDYDVDGNADDSQSNYREGCVLISEEYKNQAVSRYGRGDWHVSSNGGRDFSYSSGTLTGFDWYQRMGNLRVMEGADSRLRIEDDGVGGFTSGGAMDERLFGELVQSAAVSTEMCQTLATTGIRPYCMIDYPIYHGGTGLSIGDVSEDDWKLMEFLWAVCISTEFMMYGLIINKRQPAPDLDLYIVDTGAPLATRSLGTLSSDGETFTQRTPDETDDGGLWYITEFDNGYAWFNANPPDNNSAWPQPGNASTLTNVPTPPVGYKGIFIDRNSYVNTTHNLGAQGRASTRYDGSDATSITAGPFEGGWVHWVPE